MRVARVLHLFRAPKRRAPMEEVAYVNVVKDAGFEGCAHGRPGSKRQVLLVDSETLAAMGLAPGIIRENITTEGLDVNSLAIGQRLFVGEVELEVTGVCDPCEQIEALRPGLMEALSGKRGRLCRVLSGGVVNCGDAIVLQGRSNG